MKISACIILASTVSFISSATAGMLGDPVASMLYTVAAGSWGEEVPTVVGAGAEFSRTFNFERGQVVASLDISDNSFTFIYSNGITPIPANNGSFNMGLNGVDFTDLNQRFISATFAGSTGGFPVDSITNMLVTPNNIRIFMNGPIIPAQETWTATWNVTFAPKLSIQRSGGNVIVSWTGDATGYGLQRQTGLSTNGWLNVATSTNHITLPATNSGQFFRLLKS